MSPPRRFAVLAGGGTVGHVAPALSVAQALVARGHEPASIHFVGSARGREAELVPQAGFSLTTLPGRGIVRRLSIANVAAVLGLAVATGRAVFMLVRRRPGIVVNLGGYASLPCTVAAVLLRVPIVAVSYDAVPGAASRLAARFAAGSAVAFPGSVLPRAVTTGAPVRSEVLAIDTSPAGRRQSRADLAVPTDRHLVVVTSGSLGARRVNDATVALARRWAAREDLVLFHAVGRRDFASVVAGAPPAAPAGLDYRPVEFEPRLPAVLAAADVAVGRAGASTVAELTVLGVPSILVPLPGAPGDHQTRNAQVLGDAGAAIVLPDAECTEDRLAETIESLLGDPAALARMGTAAGSLARRDAADRIADLVESSARQARTAA
jgi:UDP-N-acetylglucosamine--N-acetylmuramyl-(pentapeptide) pyrophosphoryl-undecaprenol N-acetylglucosamine transferase